MRPRTVLRLPAETLIFVDPASFWGCANRAVYSCGLHIVILNPFGTRPAKTLSAYSISTPTSPCDSCIDGWGDGLSLCKASLFTVDFHDLYRTEIHRRCCS